MTIDQIIEELKAGNKRFVSQNLKERNTPEKIKETADGQAPYAAVLGCIDSRVPNEMVFDLGIGEIFSQRVAGNVVNEDILGGLEYAVDKVGSKVIMVLGHTKCGAVGAAHANFRGLPNLVATVDKINESRSLTKNEVTPSELERVNVLHSMNELRKGSEIIRTMEEEGKIKIIGGIYDVASGAVEFF